MTNYGKIKKICENNNGMITTSMAAKKTYQDGILVIW